MRFTLRRVLKVLALLLVSTLLIALNMSTAPFQTLLTTPAPLTYREPRNLLLSTLSAEDGLSLSGWWLPHAAWDVTSNASQTLLRNKCQLDAIHNIYQTVALPTMHFQPNSIVTLRVKVDVTAQFKIHPDQVIGMLTVDCAGRSVQTSELTLRGRVPFHQVQGVMELNIRHSRWPYCLVMVTLGCHQASGFITFANPILTAQDSRHLGYFARELCPAVPTTDEIDESRALVTVQHQAIPASSTALVGLATQLSMDRLQMLTMLRTQWSGPLNVAVFLPEPQANAGWRTKFVTKHLNALPSKHGITHATLAFPASKAAAQVYPINALRNLALSQVASDWILYLDADFVPSSGLSAVVQQALLHLPSDIDATRVAFVVPAFESRASDRASADLPASKTHLEALVRSRAVAQFRRRESPLSHAATDYHKYFQASAPLYEVTYQDKFEPYVVVKRHAQMALYPEAFTGYGLNKIAYTMTLAAQGYRFFVLTQAWCLHLPHMETRHAQAFLHDVSARVANRHQRFRLVAGLQHAYKLHDCNGSTTIL
eukprot:m.56577 g.56577  ORF g.56577 m.56577 type:complete len:542 (+) comp13691_c0_seq1:108-1733(+)